MATLTIDCSDDLVQRLDQEGRLQKMDLSTVAIAAFQLYLTLRNSVRALEQHQSSAEFTSATSVLADPAEQAVASALAKNSAITTDTLNTISARISRIVGEVPVIREGAGFLNLGALSGSLIDTRSQPDILQSGVPLSEIAPDVSVLKGSPTVKASIDKPTQRPQDKPGAKKPGK